MPLNLGFQQQMRWGWEFARRVEAWTWAPAFKPNAPSKWLRDQSAFGKYMTSAAADQALPNKMNCWEAVMFSGYLAGIYSKAEVVDSLRMRTGTQLTRLAAYMLDNPDTIVAKDAVIPATIPLGSLIMFGRESDHFAFSLGGDRVVHLDKSQQGNQTIGFLRDNGYRGGTFWPMFVKRPPAPADMA